MSKSTHRKRRIQNSVLAGLFACVFLLPSGCSTYTPYSAGEHMGNRFNVWARDIISIGKSFDRHFFNYDWDDPTLGR